MAHETGERKVGNIDFGIFKQRDEYFLTFFANYDLVRCMDLVTEKTSSGQFSFHSIHG